MLLVNGLSIYFLIMATAAVYWAAQIRSLNRSAYARALLLLCFAVCLYILGYTMEINAGSRERILFWNGVEYLGIPFVSALWLTVGLLYTGHGSRHRALWIPAVYGVPCVTLALRFTNSFHHLYFAAMSFVREDGRLLLIRMPGPWMYVQLFHSMSMIVVTLFLLIRDSLKGEEKRGEKVALLSAASAFAAGGLLLSLAKPLGRGVDYMALCLPMACVLVILSISQYDFLEMKSIARGRIFEASRDAILLVDRENRIIDYNPSAARFFRRYRLELSDSPLENLLARAPELLGSLIRTEPSVLRLCAEGAERYYEITTKSIVYHGVSRGWIKTIRNVTVTYKLNEDLKRQALMDELSGLSNRRAFMQLGQERLVRAARSDAAVYLLMMDLDQFKDVNDRYGHPTGDSVIQGFSGILREFFGPGCLIARLGGEEFAAMLPDLGGEEIGECVGALLRRVREHEYRAQQAAFYVTVSVGVAKRSGAEPLEELLRAADKALYLAKERGRNCFVVG